MITDYIMSASIAAIICTHNREKYIIDAIDSLLAQDLEDYEVLVVDNGSTDGTRKRVEQRLSHPKLRYVYEPILGLSVARNRGAQESDADILAYLDDDAEASPQWLRKLLQAYQDNQNLMIAGGKVTLLWEAGMSPPAWFTPDFAGALGAYDLGDTIVYIQNPQLTPRGVNYSLRRIFLEKVGGFDANLGRVGKKLLSNEELYMTELALNQGWQVAYLPDARVAHHVAPERINRQWFLQRSWWQGVSEYYRESSAKKTGIAQLGRGGERLLRGTYKSIKYIGNSSACFDNLVYAYGQLGYLSEVIKGMLSSNR